MKLFTKEQKINLAKGAALVPLAVGITDLVGALVSTVISTESAKKYAIEKGCGLAWQLWAHFPRNTAAQICGESCEAVCNAAGDIIWSAFNQTMLWTSVGVGTAGLLTWSVVAYRIYSNNQNDPEFQQLADEESAGVRYS